jgi:phosphoglycolate phosphatase
MKRTGDSLYRACIFDLDGTLSDTLESIAYYSNAALTQCGYRAIPAADYRRIVGDGADMQMHRMLNILRGEGNYTEEEIKSLRSVYNALYASDPLYLVKPYPGMAETLSLLKRNGLRTAVLSNKPDAWVQPIVRGLYPAGGFDLCIGQRPEIPRKPAPDGALLIARKLGVQPAECLYVGDTNTDMKTGAAAGMITVGVLWGFRGRQELEENHARYIIEKPEELGQIAAGLR